MQYTGPATLQSYQGAYVQDDIKLTKKLTVNAGIRWDYEPPRTERYNRETFWDPNYTWNIQPDPGWSWSLQWSGPLAGLSRSPIWMSQGIHGRVAEMGTTAYPQRTLDPQRTLPLRPAYWCRLPTYSQDRGARRLRPDLDDQDRKLVPG